MIRACLPRLAAILAALTVPAILAACNVTVTNAPVCVYNDQTYQVGDTFAAGDGCNSCECQEDGTVGCTLIGCVASCDYNGTTYFAGDTFPSGDGCNSCSCGEDGTVACTLADCVSTCEYEGETYDVGTSFPSNDGCNTCSCQPDGSVACTEKACAVCTYAGETYIPGDEFPATDGCNTCTCAADGTVGCTKIACDCDPTKEWWRDYVSTDPAQCQVIDYACPPNTTSFENACGCGCEQDASCPEFFNCMPPAMCDLNKIHEECPYSGIAF
jgi:hypothetical protein